MSLLNLRSFTEVYRRRSISAAARNLGLTQPAVSGHIASLEVQIGRDLFVRQPRGVSPTPFADDLAAQLGDSLDRAEEALAKARARSTHLSGAVHIAGPAELMAERVAPSLKSLQASGLDIRVHLGGKASLYEMLIGGSVDLAFTASTPEQQQLSSAFVGSETLVAVANPEISRRMKASSGQEAELLSIPLLAYDTDLPLVRDWLASNAMDVKKFHPSITAPDLRLLRALVEKGAGWSVIPDYLCADGLASGNMVQVEAPVVQPQNPFHLAWAKSALRHPRVAYARGVLLDSWTTTIAPVM